MIDTDEFLIQLIIKAIPDIDEEGLDTMKLETQPVLYDRVITHITSQINEKDRQWFLDMLEKKWVTQEVSEYLKFKIPDFSNALKKIYDDFETMYLKEFKDFEQEFPPETE